MKPQKISIELVIDIIEQIKELAKKEDRSFSQFRNLVLNEHLKNHSSQNK